MLMKDAKKGVTEEIRSLAEKEGVEPERLRSLIASGLAVASKGVPWASSCPRR